MKIVLASFRVEVIEGRDERRDALDQRWFSLLAGLGLEAHPVPNTGRVPSIVEAIPVQGVLLTGGNDIEPYGNEKTWAPERDATERALLDYARERRLPVLGVCRGMQMINVHLGGRLSPVTGHVWTRHELDGWPNEVNSYHDLGIAVDDVADELDIIATAPDGTVEALRHRILPWSGIMWHPEREAQLASADAELIWELFS